MKQRGELRERFGRHNERLSLPSRHCEIDMLGATEHPYPVPCIYGKLPLTLATWWGYAEADPLLVGVVVAAVASFALVYVGKRLIADRRPGQPGPSPRRDAARKRRRG
ncbi:MAG: hypothetical protein Tsb0020_38500 [Haliangiales bacterium]